MNSGPSYLGFPGLDRRGASGPASCWSCRAELTVDDILCPHCGANIEDEWIHCRITYRRGLGYGEFTVVYWGEVPWSVAARSDRFRWVRGEEPPRTSAVEARLAELCRTLEAEGWRRDGSREPDTWYGLSFHSFVGPPVPSIELLPPDEPKVVPSIAPVPQERAAKPVEAVAAAPPAEPVEVAPTKQPKRPKQLVASAPAPASVPVSDQAESGAATDSLQAEQFDSAPAVLTAVGDVTPTPKPVDAPANEEHAAPVASAPDPAPAAAQPEPSEHVDPVPWHVTPRDVPALTLSAMEELRRQSELLSRIGPYTVK